MSKTDTPDTPVISAQNLPTFTAAAFVTALLALVIGLYAMHQLHSTVALTQLEILMLNKKVDDLSAHVPGAAGAAAVPAPAAQPSK